jgi:alkylresorcinol/alkylpyrone synthase
MQIVGIGSAFPANVYPQQAITEAFKAYWGDRLGRPELLDRLHSRARVKSRHLAFPMERYPQFENFGATNRAWMEAAADLAERAIDGALARAGMRRDELDALFVISVTGVASPSLDARLINRMGLRSDIKRTPIFGVGCVGGAIGLTRAADYVRAYPAQSAVIVAVEICSLTVQRDDLTTVNLIASGLFADGACAVIVSGAERAAATSGAGEARGVGIVGSRSFFYPATEEIMGWDISEKGFAIVLSEKLPALIRSRLAGDVDEFLGGYGLKRGDLANWVIHPGGPRVIEAVEDTLELRHGELARSWESLERVGNLSSASVLCVLEETVTAHRPAAGSYGLVMAMGPGFCAEMLLVRW